MSGGGNDYDDGNFLWNVPTVFSSEVIELEDDDDSNGEQITLDYQNT